MDVCQAMDTHNDLPYTYVKYQDGAGNPVASVTQSRVGYSGNNTLTPSFLLPATDEYIGDPFVISFNLPEQPLAGSVKMTFTPQNDISGVVDNNGARVITFSSSLESAGNHTISASVFSTFKQSSLVSSIVPDTPLVDGTKYTLTLEYQDSIGNPASSVEHARVSYVGSTTREPNLAEPLDNDIVPGTFLSRFTLLEDTLLNSAKIIITPANSNADGNGARELTLSTKFFLQGSYEINIVATNFDDMLSANDIIAPVPSFDLLDGQDYTFRLQYQDQPQIKNLF